MDPTDEKEKNTHALHACPKNRMAPLFELPMLLRLQLWRSQSCVGRLLRN